MKAERAYSAAEERPADVGTRRPGHEVPSRAPLLLGMLVVAAGLGWLVVATVLPKLNQPPTRQGTRLIRIDPQAAHEVRIARGETRLEFFRAKDGWGLRPAAGADALVTDRLNGFLEALEQTTRLVEIGARPLSEFGLDPRRGEIVVRNGDEAKIAIGDRNPPLTGLYVQVLPGPSVVMVGAVLLWEFDKLVALAPREPIWPSKETGP